MPIRSKSTLGLSVLDRLLLHLPIRFFVFRRLPSKLFDRLVPLRTHSEFRQVYAELESKQRMFGEDETTPLVPPKPVDRPPGAVLLRQLRRDPVVAGLVSKAAATHDAIRCLLERGFTTDAHALCRVLFENATVLVWLLAEDENERKRRLDTYILHLESFKLRADSIDHAEYKARGKRPPRDFSDDRSKQISKDLFDDKWFGWAWFESGPSRKKALIRLREMAAEIGIANVYDWHYFDMSQFIHSTPASVIGGPMETRDVWIVDLASPLPARRTLALANIFMWFIFATVDRVYKFELQWLSIVKVLIAFISNLDEEWMRSGTHSSGNE